MHGGYVPSYFALVPGSFVEVLQHRRSFRRKSFGVNLASKSGNATLLHFQALSRVKRPQGPSEKRHLSKNVVQFDLLLRTKQYVRFLFAILRSCCTYFSKSKYPSIGLEGTFLFFCLLPGMGLFSSATKVSGA